MLRKEFPWARFYALKCPVQFDELGNVLEEIWASHSPRRQPDGRATGDEPIIGESSAMRSLRALLERVAPSMATVLITGESGTGKEVVVRELHRLSGRKGAFVAINCGAIPEHLLESELFGHERGAFTGAVMRRVGRFELAHGGTIFLDEIGDMPMPMQVKLLRVLQERVIERVGGTAGLPVDVRIVAATHRDLPERIKEGRFREDLYYRLSVFPIEIPPLRERTEDVAPLVREMIDRVYRRYGVRLNIGPDAMTVLEQYSWPGNARELANLIERLAVMRPDGLVDAAALPWPLRPARSEPFGPQDGADGIDPATTLPAGGLDLKEYLLALERDLISAALERADGVVQQAADDLGVRRTTLVEKINRLKLRSAG
jgi:sigma-54 specific flagellar transcriptional regulator A